MIEGSPDEPLKGDKSAIGPDPGTLQPGRGVNATASSTPWLRAVTADDTRTATPRDNPAAIRCGSCRQTFPVQRADPVGTGPDAVNGGTKAPGVDAEGDHRVVVTCPHCGKKNRIPEGAGATAATTGAPGERNSRVIPQDGKIRAAKEHDRRPGASGDPVPQSRTAAERSVDHYAGAPYVSDWPPVSYAENDNILVWWLPEYDDLIRRCVDELQWQWTRAITRRLEAAVPETVLGAWRDVDPACREFSWYNVLHVFALARAKQLGIRPREPRIVACSCCSQEFLESHLLGHFVEQLGADGIDVCNSCLEQAVYFQGSPTASAEDVTAVLQALSRALQRPLRTADLRRIDLRGLSRDARATVVQAIRVKPTLARVKELFGSWDAALAHAAAAPEMSLPPPGPVTLPLPGPDHVWPDSTFERPVPGPALYRPLATLPRGNVRFVLTGGPMGYLDLRGQHDCVSGDVLAGGAEENFAESVARVNAMVNRSPWIQAAAEVGQAILASRARGDADGRPYGLTASWITSSYRDALKAVTGRPPTKIADDASSIGAAGKSGWSYAHGADRYAYNADANFSRITVEQVPAVCIWGWPDRSDLCLQAFLDTIAAAASEPVTVILPDVPAYRSFARRYARKEHMDQVTRALLEEKLYRPIDGFDYNARAYVFSAEFAPRLIVHPDGTEDDGSVLAGALAYLGAHHGLRLSVWDILGDTLLRAAATATPIAPRTFAAPDRERKDEVQWYALKRRFNDGDEPLRPYRPSRTGAASTS